MNDEQKVTTVVFMHAAGDIDNALTEYERIEKSNPDLPHIVSTAKARLLERLFEHRHAVNSSLHRCIAEKRPGTVQISAHELRAILAEKNAIACNLTKTQELATKVIEHGRDLSKQITALEEKGTADRKAIVDAVVKDLRFNGSKQPMSTKTKRETKLAAALASVRVPPIAVSVKVPDNIEAGYRVSGGNSYGDVLFEVRGNSASDVANKLRELASMIGNSQGLFRSATVFVLGVRS